MTQPSLAGHQPSVEAQLAQLGPFYGDAPIGICLLDTEFRYLRVNKTLAEINGVPVDDHIGRTVMEVIPDVAPTFDPYLRRAMETGEPIEDFVVRVAPIGQPGAARDWSTSLYPLTADDGTVTCMSVMVREVTALDRIRQAVEESEGRYRDLVENSLGLICTHTLDGTLLSVNGAAAGSLSYEPSELVGRNLADVLDAAARPFLQDYLQHIRREGIATGIMRTIAKTGEVRYWSYRNVLREPPGQEPYVLGHAMDVTEQRRTEKELREAKEQLEQRVAERTAELSAAVGHFRRIVDRAPDAMLLVEPDGTINLVNQRTEEYFGYGPGELIGKEIELLVPKRHRKRHVNHRRAYVAEPKVICNRDPELRALRKDGTEFPVEINLVPLDETEGTPTMCTVRDLTAVRQWEAAVVEGEQQMRLMADSLPAFVAYVDKDQRYRFVNRVYEEWHGVREREIVGRRVEEFVDEELYATIEPRIGQALAGHTVNFQSEGSYPDGRKRHTDATFVPRFRADGEVIGFFSLVRDITSQVRAEEHARRSWEEMIHVSRASTMGELAASLAHELNQPLSAILSNSQAALRLLNQETPDDREARDALGDIADDARRAGAVIRRIRKLLRKGEMERSAVDINQVVEDVNCLLHSDTVVRDITVTLDLAEGLPPVSGDAAQLQQVTLNLMMNACQAMTGQEANHRALVVRTASKDGGAVEVAVEDNGPGVDPELGDRIFEPFVTSRAVGMGMGLSICRSIVEAHGGQLGTTPNPERGSTFRFVLPVALD
jgi:PAS domain S-box-containing protein